MVYDGGDEEKGKNKQKLISKVIFVSGSEFIQEWSEIVPISRHAISGFPTFTPLPKLSNFNENQNYTVQHDNTPNYLICSSSLASLRQTCQNWKPRIPRNQNPSNNHKYAVVCLKSNHLRLGKHGEKILWPNKRFLLAAHQGYDKAMTNFLLKG